MATSYPLATLAAQLTPAGISAPTLNDIIQSLVASARSIFGSGIYLKEDSQDYQLLVLFATAISDGNQADIAVYNSFRPSFAQGVALSTLVKINGIARENSSNSTADLLVVGQAGLPLSGAIAQDLNGNFWNIPDLVIPLAGQIIVTAVAQQAGSIIAQPNTITKKFTPVIGWESVTNPGSASVGAPVESDAALRRRQAASTSLPAQTPLQSIRSAISNLTGVTRSQVYDNDADIVDANGIAPHSIAAVVEGGSDIDIANAILDKKGLGTGTYGTTQVSITDPEGAPITIKFFKLTVLPIYVNVLLQPLANYSLNTVNDMASAVIEFVNSLDIGEDVYANWIQGAASLIGTPRGTTFRITSVTVGAAPNPTGSVVNVGFNQAPFLTGANLIFAFGGS